MAARCPNGFGRAAAKLLRVVVTYHRRYCVPCRLDIRLSTLTHTTHRNTIMCEWWSESLYDSLTIKISFSIVIDDATWNKLFKWEKENEKKEKKNEIKLMMQPPKIDNRRRKTHTQLSSAHTKLPAIMISVSVHRNRIRIECRVLVWQSNRYIHISYNLHLEILFFLLSLPLSLLLSLYSQLIIIIIKFMTRLILLHKP